MASLNKAVLIGNLGADPEARSLNSGGEVVNMRIATTESWKDRDGNKKERTEWHNVVIFNENLGRVAKNYLRKGSKVYLEGQLQTRKWQDQSGADKYTTEIVLQRFNGELVLLDAKASSDTRAAEIDPFMSGKSQTGAGGTAPRTSQPAPYVGAELDDDVPFVSCDPALERRVR